MTIVQIKALAEADSDGQRGTASRCSDRESRVESGDLEILKEERRDERICKIESRRIGTQESNGRDTDPTATADDNGQARQPPRAVDLTQRADDPTECSQRHDGSVGSATAQHCSVPARLQGSTAQSVRATQLDAPPTRPTVLPADTFSGPVRGCYYGTVDGETGYIWDANSLSLFRTDGVRTTQLVYYLHNV